MTFSSGPDGQSESEENGDLQNCFESKRRGGGDGDSKLMNLSDLFS